MPHVLVPLDGSPPSLEVIPLVAALRPRYVTFLNVLDRDSSNDASPFVRVDTRELAGSECRLLYDHGPTALTITATAKEVGANLIALTTHGRTGLRRLILGSVAEEVLRTSPTPVLIARAGAPPPRLPLLGRPLVGVVREGRPSTELLDLAEQEQSSLIVVASPGRGLLSRMLIGSVFQELLQATPVPLLVVR